jgi:hypothetical protein
MNGTSFLAWVLVLTFFISCKGKVERTIEGLWSIDTIVYKQYEIRNCILSNVINFNEDFCELPITENFCEGLVEYSEDGEWKFYKTDSIPLRLRINTDNAIFSGTHRMIFKKDDKNKLLKMVLYSDSLYVVCRKGLFNYDGNLGLVDDLVKISH